MEIKLKVEKAFDVKYLSVDAGVRYFKDAKVNGVEDDPEDPKMPCVDVDRWCPIINIESGVIENWEKGVKASIHYKVCDDGVYKLLDESTSKIIEVNSYVPDILCIDDHGFGDYIIMTVDENGAILNWKCTEDLLRSLIEGDFDYKGE